MYRKLILLTLLSLWTIAGCKQNAPLDASSVAPAAGQNGLLNQDKPLAQILGSGKVDKRRIALRIEKHHRRLVLLYKGKPVKAYPIVLGGNPTEDKRQEGDRCTPEGEFTLTETRAHRRWTRFLAISYPNADSWRKFRGAKRRGALSSDATIGGAIGIHGVPQGQDWLIERGVNWTLGCISLKTADIQELASVARKGTRVKIVP